MLILSRFYLNQLLSDFIWRAVAERFNIVNWQLKDSSVRYLTAVPVHPVRFFDAGRKLYFRRGREARSLVTTAMCPMCAMRLYRMPGEIVW